MNPIEWHQIHQDTRNIKKIHVEILDENDLSDLVEQEPPDKDDEVSPPQIVDVQGISGGYISGPVHSVQTRGSTVQSTCLVGTDDFGILG